MLTVVEQPKAKESLDDARDRWARADDAWDAIVWVIAHDPTIGRAMNEAGTVRAYIYEGAQANETPTLEVIYETQDPYVIVHYAVFSEPRAPKAGSA